MLGSKAGDAVSHTKGMGPERLTCSVRSSCVSISASQLQLSCLSNELDIGPSKGRDAGAARHWKECGFLPTHTSDNSDATSPGTASLWKAVLDTKHVCIVMQACSCRLQSSSKGEATPEPSKPVQVHLCVRHFSFQLLQSISHLLQAQVKALTCQYHTAFHFLPAKSTASTVHCSVLG